MERPILVTTQYRGVFFGYADADPIDGVLTIRSGYAWDGPGGPAMDTPAAMYGSLSHDALYHHSRSIR